MSVLVDERTRLAVAGITGREGTFHTLNNRRYGTNVVGGVTPGKGGQDVDGIPVFDSWAEAVQEVQPNTAMIFVPPRFAADSILEAAAAGVELVVAITEGIPAHDELRVYNLLKRDHPGTRLIGPNCPGILSPGKANVGIIPASFFKQGNVGVVSRSGTLTYQIGNEIAQAGFGCSSIVGIGGDPVPGSSFVDVLELFQADDQTELIVLSGEIGGSAEEEAAEYIAAAASPSPWSPTSPGSPRRRASRWAMPERSSREPPGPPPRRPRRWKRRACAWGAPRPRLPRSPCRSSVARRSPPADAAHAPAGATLARWTRTWQRRWASWSASCSSSSAP